MLIHGRKAALVPALLWGLCGIAEAGQGPYIATPGCCAPGVPCAPNRVLYGYFPTAWRRWPTHEFVVGPEVVPTPAKKQEAEPEELPTLPEKTPDKAAPTELVPPFGDTPPSPPGQGLEPPFGEAPPGLPAEDVPQVPAFGDEAPAPPSDAGEVISPPGATPPAQPTPGEKPLEGLPEFPLDDLPPSPGEKSEGDPFKDDPAPPTAPTESEAPGASNAAPPDVLGPDMLGYDTAAPLPLTADGPPQAPLAAEELSLPDPVDALHEVPERARQAAPAPGRRANPLRVGSQPARAAISAAHTTRVPVRASAERRPAVRANPLRSN
jgi:hypothetical protein